MFGLAARTRHIRIETRARNLMSFFPDAGGYVPQTRTIAAGAEHRKLPPSLAMRLRLAGRSNALKCEFSRDAGRYVCNYAFWRALERQSGNARGLRPSSISRTCGGSRPNRAACAVRCRLAGLDACRGSHSPEPSRRPPARSNRD